MVLNSLKIIFLVCVFTLTIISGENSEIVPRFDIEGQVFLPETINADQNWHVSCRVLVNYGEYIGFIKKDGSFVVSGILPGSYIVEVSQVGFAFEPVRVDITSKGKFRARRLNLLQPTVVSVLSYPLRLTSAHQISYFRAREEWHLMDIFSNSTVYMLALPLLLLIILPKLSFANDPEVKKEVAKTMPQMDVPDVSDMLASWLGGNPKKSAKKAGPSSKRRT